jgi:hypothetical protein
MTTNRIDHTTCSHDRTPKARAACRALRAAEATRRDRGWTPPAETVAIIRADRATAGCTINDRHCENCGSTNYEDVELGDEGYTSCCNELIAYTSGICRNHHAN